MLAPQPPMQNAQVSYNQVSQVYTEYIQCVDYEVFLGPIGLYDWDGRSYFNVGFALSL